MAIVEQDIKLDFSDVLIKPRKSNLTSRSEVELLTKFTFKHSSHTITSVPIIAANMDNLATFEMANALSKYNVMTALSKHYSVPELVSFWQNNDTSGVFYSMGILDKDTEKLNQFIKVFGKVPDMICLDVANGYMTAFTDFIKKFKDTYPETVIMAGNIVTGEMTEELINSGVSIGKIGIGPSSLCSTREKTGVGYPQLSAILECAEAANIAGGLLCSDGGCTVPGDVAKALAVTDFVMLGGMLSGHDEGGGEKVLVSKKLKVGTIEDPGKNGFMYYVRDGIRKAAGFAPDDWFDCEYKMKFYGMSSSEAMKKHSGGVAEYRSSEGRSVWVPYKGTVDNTINDILGGIRSACTYTGSHNLTEFKNNVTFIHVNKQLNMMFGKGE